MDTSTLDKLSREELVQIIKQINQQNEVISDNEYLKSLSFKSIVEDACDIIYVIDKDLNMQYLNKAWKEAFPSREAVPPGMNYKEYLPEVDPERSRFVEESIFKRGQIFRNELLKVTEDGNLSYFITNYSPIRSKTGVVILIEEKPFFMVN